MNITAIINRISAPRTFSVSAANGMQKDVVAVEVELRSGAHVFVGEAYDDVARYAVESLHQGDAAVATLVFSTREATTRDGGKFVSQKVNISNIQSLNPHF